MIFSRGTLLLTHAPEEGLALLQIRDVEIGLPDFVLNEVENGSCRARSDELLRS